jgi:hypothetical protein
LSAVSSRRDIHIRQHFMERSFAQATRFGLKRARWSGQLRVQIQDYLIAVVQNIQLMIAHARPKPRTAVRTGINTDLALMFLQPFALRPALLAL